MVDAEPVSINPFSGKNTCGKNTLTKNGCWFTKLTFFIHQHDAGWSSLVARWAHNPKVGSSNLPPATNKFKGLTE